MNALKSRLPLVVIALLLALSAPAAADTTPEFFNLPAGYDASGGIAAAPDGTVWFATGRSFGPAEIGRLLPTQAAAGTANGVATFPTPAISLTNTHITRNVAYDAANNRVWFVQSDGIVGWADPAAVNPGTTAGMRAVLISTTTRSGPYAPGLGDVAVDSRGVAWFTESGSYNVEPYPGGRIARITPELGVTELGNIALQGGRTTLDSLRYPADPLGIAIDANDRPWFAESNPGNPGWRIGTPRGGGPDYDEYLVTPCAPAAPCSGSYTGTGITDVAVARDGAIWFTNQLRNEVGRLDVANATFTSYSLPAIDAGLATGQPRAIATAADGSLWVAEHGGYGAPSANAIVKIVPGQNGAAPTATVFHLGRGRYPSGVAPDTRGNVWFTVATDVAPGQVGRLAGVVGAGGGGGGSGGGGSGGGGGGRVLRPASVGVARVSLPSVDGTRLSVDQICVGPPQDRCSLVYILSAHEYVTGFPGSRSSSAHASAAAARGRRGRGRRGRARRARAVILGQTSLTLRGGQRRRVTVSLNAAGRRLLRRAGRLTLYFTVLQRTAGGRPKRVKAVRVTFKQPRARRRGRGRR